MHAFPDLAGVHETLERLIGRELVQRLERRPGHKEERYAQLLQDHEAEPAGSPAVPSAVQATGVAEPPAAAGGFEREPATAGAAPGAGELAELRERVARLEREVAALRAGMRDPVYQP
jgi:uncharacterized protein YceH (UPF0502 family)